MMTGSINDIIRVLFLGLDTVVYWLVDQAYYLFQLLTEVSIFTQDQIKGYAQNFYVLVSIIMLFKLGFSFITYIVNPDAIIDKQKGGVALFKKVIVAIVLLVSVPTIFSEAFYVQKLILEQDIISKVLLNDTSTKEESYVQDGETKEVESSNVLSTYAFLSFFRPSSHIEGCSEDEGIDITSTCIEALNSKDTTGHNPGNAYQKALTTLNIDFVLNTDIINTKGQLLTASNNGQNGNFYSNETIYLFEYHYLISTIFGVILAYIMIGFCIDLAVRAVKIGFLQIIAPIPIIMSIAPGQKTNTLNNWGKECFSTWASLFIRMLVISFSLSAIIMINSSRGVFSMVTGGGNRYFLVNVFIMLGLLLFAKEFPKLLEDMLGMKGTGKLTLNPWKKLASVPLVGGAMTAGLSYMGNLGKNALAAPINKLRGRDTNFKENMDFARQEALGRLRSSGIAGSDKGYSGDTQHKLVSKRNQDIRKKMFDAKKGLDEKDRLYDMGAKSRERIVDLKTVDDYKKAGFKDDNFIKAAIGIDRTKDALKGEQANLRTANEQVSALTNSLHNFEASGEIESLESSLKDLKKNAEDLKNSNLSKKDYMDKRISIQKEIEATNDRLTAATTRRDSLVRDLANATKDRDGYVESTEKLEKILKNRTDIFEQNIAPISGKDYELYQARNVAKGGEKPSNYGTPNLPVYGERHYTPGQYSAPTSDSQTSNSNPATPPNNLGASASSNNSSQSQGNNINRGF